MFPNFGNVRFCCLKDLNRVRGKMVTLNNEVSLRIEMTISSCQITIILSSNKHNIVIEPTRTENLIKTD